MLTLDRRIELTNRLCYLFVIFLIGCLTGWIYEEIFYWYTEGMLRNRGICTAHGCRFTASARWASTP